MALSDKHLSQLEQYIDGTLGAAERSSFEQELRVNVELKEALDTRLVMLEALKVREREALRKKLSLLREETRNTNASSKPQPLSYLIKIGAALLMLIALYFTYRQLSYSPPSAPSLFEAYYEAFPVTITRGSEAAGKVRELYSKKAFKEAIPLLQDLVSAEADHTNQYRLLLASCYLETGQPEKVPALLSPLLAMHNSTLQSHGRWYAMLAYLLMDEPQKARELLEQVRASGDDYARQAQLILEKLDL